MKKSSNQIVFTTAPAFTPDNTTASDQPVVVQVSDLLVGPINSRLLVLTLVNPNSCALNGKLTFKTSEEPNILGTFLEVNGTPTPIQATIHDCSWSCSLEAIPPAGTVKIVIEYRLIEKLKPSRHPLLGRLFHKNACRPLPRIAAECCCMAPDPGVFRYQSVGGVAPLADGLCESDALGCERYAEYHENTFVETLREPLSTFGLDVDTASYTTMRRYIEEYGRLPPKDSVRLEEFVNYFPYSYAEPTDDAPIAANCELAPCPWNADHKLLRVGVQARRIAEENLPPSNLVFLLDVSGSMNGNGGFDMLKKSMRMLVDRLRPEDSVAIVTYADETRLYLPATKGTHKDKIRTAVEALSCGGCTYGAGGIQMAYQEAKRNFDARANNRVILMTDGDFNVGISSPKELEDFIRTERGTGIFLSILGVGRGNYHDDTMKKLSTAGKGNYAFIDSLLEAKKVLVNEFGGTLFTVAKDVKLQLEFNPARVASYRLLGYESRALAARDFNDDKKDGGETGSGHSMTAFYELVPVGAPVSVPSTDPLKYQQTTLAPSDELLTVKLRYKDPQGDTSKLMEYPVKEDAIDAHGDPTEDFRFAAAVAEFALLLEDSPFKGTASFATILARAKSAKGADPDCLRAEFIRLVEMAQLLGIKG